MQWNPELYQQFAAERGRPYADLLSRVQAQQPRQVVDLGCGDGALTATLAERWPEANIHGLDSSADMITAARQHAAPADSAACLTFAVGDLADFSPGPDTDVILSNAALQWVPDHVALLSAWASSLSSGACLAWQVPGNFDAPAHVLLREVAERPRWRDVLEGVLRHRGAVAEPVDYAELLLDAGLDAEVWETTYLHLLTGPDPVLQWMRGTGLRPVRAALAPDEIADFEAEYGTALRDAYPAGPHGTHLPFRRILSVGHVP